MKRFVDDEEMGPSGKDDSKESISFERKSDEDNVGGKSVMSRNLKLAFCFLGLQVSYVLWGVAQEQIMTQVYKPGKFTSSTVRVNL
jgi:hypothetical protein